MKKRGYSRSFTPKSDSYGRYLLDKIPATLWRSTKAKAKRDGVSVRAVLLTALTTFTEPSPDVATKIAEP